MLSLSLSLFLSLSLSSAAPRNCLIGKAYCSAWPAMSNHRMSNHGMRDAACGTGQGSGCSGGGDSAGHYRVIPAISLVCQAITTRKTGAREHGSTGGGRSPQYPVPGSALVSPRSNGLHDRRRRATGKPRQPRQLSLSGKRGADAVQSSMALPT